MRKITAKKLDELAKLMPVLSEIQQRNFIGGGDGSIYSPYTVDEFDRMVSQGMWYGGYVDGWGLTGPEVTVLGSYSGSGTNGGSGSNDGSLYGDSGSFGDSGNMINYNVSDAINHLTDNALDSSSGYCAKYVRQALEAGGISTEGRPTSACDYDTYLTTIGFSTVDSSNYTPQVGDIIVHEATTGHSNGHIAMYNGKEWISDFKQNDMYGGSAYRDSSNYTILRWK